MSVKIEGTASGRVEMKRFLLPGVVQHQTCPECGHKRTKDYADEYLEFPFLNRTWALWCWCPECDHEWPIAVRLNVSLELVG